MPAGISRDTVYKFAEGKYIIKFNFCKYQGKKLFLRCNDPHSKAAYHYIEIPEGKRMHLHNYNDELRQGETASLVKQTREFLLTLDCKG